VVKITKELVEAMHGGQKLIAVAEMVFAELSGRISEQFQKLGDGRIFGLQSLRRTGNADFGEAGA